MQQISNFEMLASPATHRRVRDFTVSDALMISIDVTALLWRRIIYDSHLLIIGLLSI